MSCDIGLTPQGPRKVLAQSSCVAKVQQVRGPLTSSTSAGLYFVHAFTFGGHMCVDAACPSQKMSKLAQYRQPSGTHRPRAGSRVPVLDFVSLGCDTIHARLHGDSTSAWRGSFLCVLGSGRQLCTSSHEGRPECRKGGPELPRGIAQTFDEIGLAERGFGRT